MKTHQRLSSKARLKPDESLSLLSTRSSNAAGKVAFPLSARVQRTIVIPSPKAALKTTIPRKEPVVVPRSIGRKENEGKRGKTFVEKGNSENQSLNNSVASSRVATASLNTSSSNATVPTDILTPHNRPSKPPSAKPQRSRQISMDLHGETAQQLFSKLQLPIPGDQALRLFPTCFSVYERAEVLEYQSVYFLRMKTSVFGSAGTGFDDDRGDYKVAVGDHIAYRYEVVSLLGKGSFGQVLKVLDHKTNETQALKIIRNKSRFHHQAEVEIKILKRLCEKDASNSYNVVHLREHFVFRSHVCITFELLTLNLYDFLKSNNFQGLSPQLIKRFALQLLTGLEALKSHQVIHCDLKPENILLKLQHKSAIKIIDFGSSCFESERMYTYIQSRFYRAPEVILGLPYSSAIDMWSLGCILAELATGVPIFPGESETEQLLCIMQVIGTPPCALLDRSSRKKVFFDDKNEPKIVANRRGKKRYPGTRALKDILGEKDIGFVDFIQSER